MSQPETHYWRVVYDTHLGSIAVCIVDTSIVALVQPLKGKRGEEKSGKVCSPLWKPGQGPGRPHTFRKT